MAREALEGRDIGFCGWKLVGEVLMEPEAASSSLNCGLLHMFFVNVSQTRVIVMLTVH